MLRQFEPRRLLIEVTLWAAICFVGAILLSGSLLVALITVAISPLIPFIVRAKIAAARNAGLIKDEDTTRQSGNHLVDDEETA